VMKLVALILVCGFLQLSAASYSQEITLKGSNIPLVSVFKSISQQTGYEVAGFEISLDKAKPVTVSAKQMPINDFLQLVFHNQPFTYKIEGRTIFVAESKKAMKRRTETRSGPVSFISQRVVTGRVTDERGNPLEGVTV